MYSGNTVPVFIIDMGNLKQLQIQVVNVSHTWFVRVRLVYVRVQSLC